MIPSIRSSWANSAHGPLLSLMNEWVEQRWIRELDATFAIFLWEEVPSAHPHLILAAMLASHQLGRGHVCLDIDQVLSDPEFMLSVPLASPDGSETPSGLMKQIDPIEFSKALACSDLVGNSEGTSPLVLEENRLYLRRYWRYEQDIRNGIAQRLARQPEIQESLDMPAMREALDTLFSSTGSGDTNWQKIACALAARSPFSIITGGPGTGKTTTVVRLLALLQALELGKQQQHGAPQRALRIRLAAPTGKAAARLNESISSAVDSLPLGEFDNGEDIHAEIPRKVNTLHRLLGSRPDSRKFRHDSDNLLALDVLVIDEASMVDLEMMANVLNALPASARLILLGDKDQLSSVEAGAVLGVLCQRARDGHYTRETVDWVEQATGEQIDAGIVVDPTGRPMDQSIIMLRYSHRFSSESGIGILAEAVNLGRSEDALQILRHGYKDLYYLTVSGPRAESLRAVVRDGCVNNDSSKGSLYGYRHYLETASRERPADTAGQVAFDDWAACVLQAHRQFQVLCALRNGPWGLNSLNERIAQWLHKDGLIPAKDGWYLGRPVLVTRNSYGLGLMNGDIGITLEVPASQRNSDETGMRLMVAFPSGDGTQGVKWVLPSRLQHVETVFALTVHKSQGSEFTHTVLVLPDAPSPIVTRELVYTGITRAKSFLTLINPGEEDLLVKAVKRQVQRSSGL